MGGFRYYLIGWYVSCLSCPRLDVPFLFFPFLSASNCAFPTHACITWSYTYIHSNTQKGRKEGRKDTHSLTLSRQTRQTDKTSALTLLPSLLCLFFFLFFSSSPPTSLSLSFLISVSVLIHFVLVSESFVRLFVQKALPG